MIGGVIVFFKQTTAYRVRISELSSDFCSADLAVLRRGRRGMPAGADVALSDAVARMVAAVEAELGPVGILVNNAGLGAKRELDDLTEEDWDETIAVNLKSAFLCTQAVYRGMRDRGWGRVVNVTSGAARGAGAVGVDRKSTRLNSRH